MSSNLANTEVFSKPISVKKVIVQKVLLIENYFNYLGSIVEKYQPLTTYYLNEHLLVRANPWIR